MICPLLDKGFICFITIVILSVSVFNIASAQDKNGMVTGTVQDDSGEPVPFAYVLIESLNMGTTTDGQGAYILKNIPQGSYTFTAKYMGYTSQQKTLTVNGHHTLNFTIAQNTQELEEVQVRGKSEATLVREQSYAVEVVNSRGFKNLSTNANDILGKVSGVNIRQSGGLGSQFSLSLNGLSGNQLRVFLDGIPMDYFGSSLSLNNFSANLLERIEVYKGVVPIHLSADALGGAINVVTNKNLSSYLDASYSIGSFNTHIASLNGQYRNAQSGYTVRLKSFYNTSQNNYQVPVHLINFETGKESEEETWVERFHDAYDSKMAWVETGFTGTRFADELMVGVLYSDNYKELQQPANAVGQASIPYGEVANQEKKIISNLSFHKTDMLNDRLNIRAYMVGVFSENISVDTSSYRYDWFGSKEAKTNASTGEIENRKTWLTLNIDNYLANLNTEFAINSNHSLAANYSLNHVKVEGQDPFKEENNTQFSKPSTVAKQVVGLSYTQSFLSKRLKNSFFSKVYTYHLSSLETNYQGTELIPFELDKDYVGYGFSSTFHLNQFQFKASFERATRFPEIVELFGDGLNYEANTGLLPEQSNNYNLGFLYDNTIKNNRVTLSANGFIRNTDDLILPQSKGIKTYHYNLGKGLSKGIDLSASYSIKNQFAFTLNGTYLNKVNNSKWRNGEVGVPNSQYKIRVPNEPYLFGNLTFSYRKSHLVLEDDNFSATVIQNYVHEFYYRWENLASKEKGTVPEQWTTNLDFVYSLKDEQYNFSFGVTNLWDARVYDNFQQLRPGRTYNFKIRYFIN